MFLEDFGSQIQEEDSSTVSTGTQTTPKAVSLTEAASTADPIIWPLALRAISMRPAYLESSAWFEHIPFAFWLMEAHRPRQFVELGTHLGTSYFAFCQAIERLGMDTRCFAIDTWKGDEHAGFYGPEVFQKVQRYNDSQYSGFSRLVRSTFDDALKHFSDSTVDLLHIDGLHSLEAVRHDFESWLPKLSESGVVLMHDTNVRERNFGVFKLFEELREIYPFFEFLHGHGLGVLGIGEKQNEHLQRLFQAQHDKSGRRVLHEVFGRLGRACADAFVAQQRQGKELELRNAVTSARAQIEGLQTVRTELEDSLGELRKSEQENQHRITKLEAERDQLQLENGRLTKNIQTRFDELAKLTKMLLDTEESTRTLEARVTRSEGRVANVVSEIARLDRMTEMQPPPKLVTTSKHGPTARNFEIGLVSERPMVMEFSAEGEKEVLVKVALFGEVEGRVTAARLTAEALDCVGKVLAGTRWKRSRGFGGTASHVREIMRRSSLRFRRKEHCPNSCLVLASPEGEMFSGRLKLPEGASRLRLNCERLIKGRRLLLVRGNTTLFDRPVVPNGDLTLKFEVRAERSLQRAVMLVPQYFDAADQPLPPPYPGFRSDEANPAFAHLSSAAKARRTTLQLSVPASAVRLRLQMRPALARGRVDIVEMEPLEPVFSFTREPRKGTIKVSLTLLAPFDTPQAAVLLQTYYGDGGARMQDHFQCLESSKQVSAFHYLPASPLGVTTTLALAVPPGVQKCRLDVVPWNLSTGLRVEVGSAAKEAADIDGALLPADGVGLECEAGSGAILWFKLRVTGARDLKNAGTCVIRYFGATGDLIPLPYPGLQGNDGERGVVPFGASFRPQGRVEIIKSPCPPGAAKARLRFLPNVVEDALRIRIEPIGNRRSIVKGRR